MHARERRLSASAGTSASGAGPSASWSSPPASCSRRLTTSFFRRRWRFSPRRRGSRWCSGSFSCASSFAAPDSTFVLSLHVMARERKDVLVRMPADLKRDLAREVDATEGNLNDLAVGILASRFAVPFESSGRKSGRPSEKGDVLLRMPLELKDKLTRRARERKRTVNQLIVETLTERLGTHRKEKMASSNGSKNGRAHGNGKVRVAIIGVGNCANSLLQGVEYYTDADA